MGALQIVGKRSPISINLHFISQHYQSLKFSIHWEEGGLLDCDLFGGKWPFLLLAFSVPADSVKIEGLN